MIWLLDKAAMVSCNVQGYFGRFLPRLNGQQLDGNYLNRSLMIRLIVRFTIGIHLETYEESKQNSKRSVPVLISN